MNIQFHRNFEKQHKKLKKQERVRAKERLILFLKDEFNPMLNNHPLSGKYKGYRSINITGDIRAIYKRYNHNICIFVDIGIHSNLYR